MLLAPGHLGWLAVPLMRGVFLCNPLCVCVWLRFPEPVNPGEQMTSQVLTCHLLWVLARRPCPQMFAVGH